MTDRRRLYLWQVVRTWTDGAAADPVCSHKGLHRAKTCAFWRNVFTIAGGHERRYWYDVRRLF